MVSWDEAKRKLNIKAHQLHCTGCEAIFDGPVITFDDDRLTYGEQRLNSLGLLGGQVVSMTCTEREDNLHATVLRMATTHEARYFFSQI